MMLNRTDMKGEIANPLAALAAVAVVNAVALLGMGGSGSYPSVSIEPPTWFVALAWAAIFPMWGLARWHALRAGREGRRLAAFIVLMMVWSLFYAAVTVRFDLYKCVACNAITLLVVGFAVIRACSVSKTAMWWMVPSLAWVAFANVLTVAKIAAVDM
jgi:tryptophan-rich sensory protein